MMDHEELRIEALRLAKDEGLSGPDLLARAQELYHFIRYGADGATETRAVLDGVTLNRADGSVMPAKVVAKDKAILDKLRNADGYQKE